MISEITEEIVFIATNPTPQEHFAAFAEALGGRQVRVIFLKQLPQSETEQVLLAKTIAKSCRSTKYVITEVGHPFYSLLMDALAKKAPEVKKIAYYDNRERFVGGGFSDAASKVCLLADAILFANSTHVQNLPFSSPGKVMNIQNKELIGLGYFSMEEIENLKKMREQDGVKVRKAFFKSQGIEDKCQNIAVYFGGANSLYYTEAFPLFCELLQKSFEHHDFSNTIILLQQHPRAKQEGDLDALCFKAIQLSKNAATLLVSNLSFSDAVVLADLAIYHQTSSSLKLLLAGVPMVQVGETPYEDVLVRQELCSKILTSEQFLRELSKEPAVYSKQALDNLYKESGIDLLWKENLITALK